MNLSQNFLFRFIFISLFIASWVFSLLVIFSAPPSTSSLTKHSVNNHSDAAGFQIKIISPHKTFSNAEMPPTAALIENPEVGNRQPAMEIDPKTLTMSAKAQVEGSKNLMYSTMQSNSLKSTLNAGSPRYTKYRLSTILGCTGIVCIILLVKARARRIRRDRYVHFIHEQLKQDEIVSEFTYMPSSNEIGYGSFMPRTWSENAEKFDV